MSFVVVCFLTVSVLVTVAAYTKKRTAKKQGR